MRKIEFSELKLNEKYNEDGFFQTYINTLPKEKTQKITPYEPIKKYEIFWLNILGGKIILLNKKHIKNTSTEYQELYYDYKTAYKIYNLMMDIYDGLNAEEEEINELYLNERLKKSKEIEKLKQQDNLLFEQAIKEYKTATANFTTALNIPTKKDNIFKRLLKLFKHGEIK